MPRQREAQAGDKKIITGITVQYFAQNRVPAGKRWNYFTSKKQPKTTTGERGKGEEKPRSFEVIKEKKKTNEEEQIKKYLHYLETKSENSTKELIS